MQQINARMRYFYKVAGLVFCIESDTVNPSETTNFQPFAIEPPTDTPIFTLHIGQYDFGQEKTLFYTDTFEEDMPRIVLYTLANGDWLLEESPTQSAPMCLQMRTNKDFTEAWLTISEERWVSFALNNASMLLFAFASVHKQVLEIHASVTVKDGYGYLFLGKSGTGKSTHSVQWMKAFADAWLLNDDNPILRVEGTPEEPQVIVYGSPWSGKTPCYKNASVPVGAIVKLDQAPDNVIRPLKLSEAYAYMLSSVSGLKIIPEVMDALYQTIVTIIQTIQVYHLDCLPNTDAAQVCFEAVHHA